MAKINKLNALNPGRTKLVNIGNSYEQRQILGLEVRKLVLSSKLIILKDVVHSNVRIWTR